MRSDARSNRLRILEAAAEVLATPGDTSLKSIARRAGVGQGTLYRHFPTREALVLQVYGEEVDGLVTAVPVLLDSLCPRLALRAWLERLLSLGRRAPEFADAMSGATGEPTRQCREAYLPLLGALSALVSANEAAGTIAPGTTADDVLLLLGPLWHVGGVDADRARAVRLFETVIRGLCPSGTAQDVPGPEAARHAG
ncbi:TetR/AcrR family transcriptional regulator [Streptomyces brasiliensis]|uniref:TetR family transcriptional regulator n=1 Tax=Streptomyces brasiliensis TaxID=1954 RepID=A0A917P964_9ACTN|nr:TetR/AcrR family transcriptional regulator [Streptomyces brasiliensis]GGJ67315.1 TetR family transcriptional regulator [Streptomyces brasiliensis]